MKEELFLQKIKEEFPEIKWKQYRPIISGWDHLVIAFDNKLVFRVPKGAYGNSRDTLFNEIGLLKYLKGKLDVNIPEYIYVSRDKSFGGYKMLKGEELKGSYFEKLDLLEKEELIKQLAVFLTTLHSTPKTVVDKFSVRIDSPDENYIRLLDDTKKTLFSRFNKDEIKITNEFFSELKDVLRHEYLNALVHNDLTSKNMFWDSEKKRINIIDFSDRSFSDPAIDFAGLWELSEELVEKVYKLYDGRKDNKFLYRSKLYYKRIPFLMMRGALEGYPGSFQGGYKVFRKRFKLI